MKTVAQIFLSYAREDKEKVKSFYQQLSNAGFKPWMDTKDILPGERWKSSIQKAIRRSDFFLACLSANSVNKRGLIQKEIKDALDIWQEMLEGDIYLIPVRLEGCEVPETLHDFQWVNLFEEGGWTRLVKAIQVGMERRALREERILSLYNLDNIRTLLTEKFSIDELRRFCYDFPAFRPVYDQLARDTSKTEITNRLIEYADRTLNFETLLDWAKQYNPIGYRAHQPYYSAGYSREPEIDIRPLDNPYVVGNPIQPTNTKVFLGRFDIANAIISEIKKSVQKPSILLYGRRRMGKTSALLNISSLVRDPSFIDIYISGQSARFHTNVDFCYYLVREINERLQQASVDVDTSPFQKKGFLKKDTFLQNPVLTLSEFFEECQNLLYSHRLYCLLAIDEYEEIDAHINISPGHHHQRNITRELLLELRDILQHRPRFMFLFAGTHYLRDLSTVNWSEIFINVKTLHISFLEREDGYKLLTQPVPGLKYESREFIERILDLTGCQPFLLQAIASELVNILNFKNQRTVTREVLDEAIDKVLVEYNTYFDYIWDTECSDIKHRRLLKIVTAKASDISEAELVDYRDELRGLIRREVLKIEEGVVKLTMPIVKYWMKKNQHIL